MKQKIFFLLTCLLTISAFAQNADFRLPAYEKFVLKNGLTVYLMEQKEVPMINVSVILHAGAINDGKQYGLANMTASSLMNGTKTMSKTKLEEELDFLGASVSTYASKESAGLNAKFASKDADKVLPIIKDILLNPLFDAAEFEKEKTLHLSELERAAESPRNVIGNYFDQVIYGSHVYSNPEAGKLSTVAKLKVEDAKKFYSNFYIPNSAAIAIVGNFNAKDMKAKISALLNSWQKKPLLPSQASQPVTKPSAAKVMLVNKDDAKETTFYIGGAGVPRNHPDYVAMEVVNTIFGGRFTSWLNDELRVNTGLTYGARSSFSRLKNAGSFSISTFTSTKNTEAAIDKAIEVLNRLHDKGVDEETLTSAKNYVKGGFPPRYETSGQLASLLTSMFWHGFDESFINNFQKNVDELTVEKTRSIIARHFPKNNLQFVLIGKAAEIRKIAEKYGPVTEVQIKDGGAGKSF